MLFVEITDAGEEASAAEGQAVSRTGLYVGVFYFGFIAQCDGNGAEPVGVNVGADV